MSSNTTATNVATRAADGTLEPLTSFGVFADAHYAHRVYGSRYCRHSLTRLQGCVDTFNARSLPIAVNLGDLIDTEESKEAELASLAAMCQAYARFRGKRCSAVGNHDLGTLTKAEVLGVLRGFDCGPADLLAYGSLEVSGVHFVVLDSNCHQDGADFGRGAFQWDDAWISLEQIAWLEQDLEQAYGSRAIVLCHGNLCAPGEESDPHTVRNAAVVRSVLERAGNVCAVVQGHYHPGMYRVVDGIPYIGLAAMVEGAGLENNAYAVISLYGDGRLAVEGFGRQVSFWVAA